MKVSYKQIYNQTTYFSNQAVTMRLKRFEARIESYGLVEQLHTVTSEENQ